MWGWLSSAGCCADQGLAFGDIRVFECLAFNPADAVIILVAKLQGVCYWSSLRLIGRTASGRGAVISNGAIIIITIIIELLI